MLRPGDREMPSTILLDREAWDLVLDADGNIAAAAEPYSLAQDAASAIRTFLGEVYFDTAIGVPYLSKIFGKKPQLSLLKAEFERAARTVEGVAAAQCFLFELGERRVGGQIQVTSAQTGQTTAANFSVVNPQGVG